MPILFPRWLLRTLPSAVPGRNAGQQEPGLSWRAPAGCWFTVRAALLAHSWLRRHGLASATGRAAVQRGSSAQCPMGKVLARSLPAAGRRGAFASARKPLVRLALRTSLSMQGQSRNTKIRYDWGNDVIGGDLIATDLGAYGKNRWRRVEPIGLTGRVTLGAGDIDIAANCWIDGHASCRHLCSVLQAKLCPHPVTELPNSENHQNE